MEGFAGKPASDQGRQHGLQCSSRQKNIGEQFFDIPEVWERSGKLRRMPDPQGEPHGNAGGKTNRMGEFFGQD